MEAGNVEHLEKVMITTSKGVTKLLLLYLYEDVIRPSELTSLKLKYAAALNLEERNVESALDGIK